MDIRHAKSSDAMLLYELMQSAFKRFEHDATPAAALNDSLLSIKQQLRRGLKALIVSEAGQPVAMSFYTEVGNDCFFSRFSVHPDHQRKGLGKIMLLWLAEDAKTQGLQTLSCLAREQNLHYYERLGFQVSCLPTEETGLYTLYKPLEQKEAELCM
ncbi:GNAT family N-acetyltransferase [Shouchella shacheensis]|uniref:GNAT family N-acetyltransferase n=1 Tax=Shouchella shacheensis TaxID=1649580 RepID=UPI000740274D|nr:GNAT family N-acetyltransferase [Shouchella shacheensis]